MTNQLKTLLVPTCSLSTFFCSLVSFYQPTHEDTSFPPFILHHLRPSLHSSLFLLPFLYRCASFPLSFLSSQAHYRSLSLTTAVPILHPLSKFCSWGSQVRKWNWGDSTLKYSHLSLYLNTSVPCLSIYQSNNLFQTFSQFITLKLQTSLHFIAIFCVRPAPRGA